MEDLIIHEHQAQLPFRVGFMLPKEWRATRNARRTRVDNVMRWRWHGRSTGKRRNADFGGTWTIRNVFMQPSVVVKEWRSVHDEMNFMPTRTGTASIG